MNKKKHLQSGIASVVILGVVTGVLLLGLGILTYGYVNKKADYLNKNFQESQEEQNSKIGKIDEGDLKEKSINIDKLAEQVFLTAQTGSGTVSVAEVQTAIITTKNLASNIFIIKYLDGETAVVDIKEKSITDFHLADGSVTTAKIVDQAVTTAKLADGTVTEIKITDGVITSGKIADGTIKAIDLENGSIIEAKISDGAVTNSKLADNSITTSKISNLSITAAKIATGTITGTQIASDGTVVKSLIAGSEITVTNNNDGSWTIADSSGGVGDVVIAPTSAQTDSTTRSTINLNKTGASGNLLQMAVNGTDTFVINHSGIITTGTWQGTTIANGYIASALSGKTYEGLTLTSNADGFAVQGGTTARTLTITGANVGINQSLRTTDSPTFVTITGTTLTDGTATLTGGAMTGATYNGLAITTGANTFNLTRGTSSLDLASGKAVDINMNLTVNTADVTLNQSLQTSDSVAFTGLSNTDANITNVGNIALDSISADATDIDINITDPSATALQITDGTTTYLTFDSTAAAEKIEVGATLDLSNTIDMTYNDGATALITNGVIQAAAVEDKFLRNDGDDTTTGIVTMDSLKIQDTNDSHTLNFVWNENEAAANRTLNLLLGGGNRSLTLNEDFTIGDGANVTITAEDNASTLTLDNATLEVENLNVTQRNVKISVGTDANATLSIEGLTSAINQDLTTDASVAFTGLSNTDANITNVGNIALDSISADATDIDINITDPSATALQITDGTTTYLTFDSTAAAEKIEVGATLDLSNTIDMTYNDGATALITNGVIQAAAVEDKFLRNDGNDTTSGSLTIQGGGISLGKNGAGGVEGILSLLSGGNPGATATLSYTKWNDLETVNGIVKSNGAGDYSAAVADTDYQQVVVWNNGLTYLAGTANIDYNATNLQITAGQINTIQNIAITSSPTFDTVTATTLTDGTVSLNAGKVIDATEINMSSADNRQIYVNESAADTAGKFLAIKGGNADQESLLNLAGGSLYLSGGSGINAGVAGNVLLAEDPALGALGKVGIGNPAPSNLLDVGSTTAGGNVGINATIGAEEAPALTEGNWTIGAGWENPIVGPGLIKNADGTGTQTPSAATTIVAGTTYKVVITLSAWTVGSATYTLGGVTGQTLAAASTYTDYITASTTGKLIITPTNASRFTISAISIKSLTNATGNLTIDGNLILKSPIQDAAGTDTITLLNGNMGIGTTAPGAKLEVEIGSTDAVTGLLIDADDTDQIAMQIQGAQIDADVLDIVADAITTVNAIDISADALSSGNGINIDSTSTAFAGKLLDLTASGAANGTTRYGVYSSLTGAGTTSTNIAGYFNAQNGTTANYAGIFENGNVGIGDTTPTHQLEIAETDSEGALSITNTYATGSVYGIITNASGASTSNFGISGGASGATYNYGISGNATGTTTNYGVYGYASGGATNYAGYFSGQVYIQTFAAAAATHVCQNGNVLSSCSPDYVEYVPTDNNVEPADIVSISQTKENLVDDPDSPFVVEKSTKTKDPLMVGIMSSAEGGNGEKKAEHYKGMAFIGQVPVKVNNENGEIKKGDYITSSSEPGIGMKANLGDPTIAIAVENFNGAAGKIRAIIVRNNGSNVNNADIDGDSLQSQFDKIEVNQILSSSGKDLELKPSTGKILAYGDIVVKGKLTIEGDLEIQKHFIGNHDTRGTVVIPAGETETEFIFDTPYLLDPSVVASPLTKGVLYYLEIDRDKFKIKLEKPANTDLQFSWIAEQ